MSISTYRMGALEPAWRRALAHPLTAPFAGVLESHGARLARFGIVGIIGVAINMAVLYLAVRALGVNHLVAAGIASEVSIVGNYTLNDRWTFGDAASSGTWLSRLARYNAVALGGMTISLVIMFALTTVLGVHYLIANLVAIASATLSNYALNSRFTWSLGGQNPELVPVPVALD